MKKSNAPTPSQPSGSLWISIFSTIKRLLNAFIQYIAPTYNDPLPAKKSNETDVFIQRFLSSHQTWLDKLSSKWWSASVFKKIFLIGGVTLISGLIGLIMNAPILMALASLSLAIVAHRYLLQHENNRREKAALFAEEQIALQQDLTSSMDFFKTAGKSLTKSTQAFDGVLDAQKKLLAALEEENHSVNGHNQAIASATRDVTEAVKDGILNNAQSIQSQFNGMSDTLSFFNEQVKKASVEVKKFNQATANFTDMVTQHQPDQPILP